MPGTAEQVWDAIATANGITPGSCPPTWRSASAGSSGSIWARTSPREHHPLGTTPPDHLRRTRLGRPQRARRRGRHSARQRVHRRSQCRRDVCRACREQRIRNRRRLGAGVLRRDGAGLGAVLRPPASVPPALPGPAGHAAVRRCPGSGYRRGGGARDAAGARRRRDRSTTRRARPGRALEAIEDTRLLLRVAGPVPGYVAFIAWDMGDGKANANVAGYLFSEKASAYVEAERSNWKAWLDDLSVHTA